MCNKQFFSKLMESSIEGPIFTNTSITESVKCHGGPTSWINREIFFYILLQNLNLSDLSDFTNIHLSTQLWCWGIYLYLMETDSSYESLGWEHFKIFNVGFEIFVKLALCVTSSKVAESSRWWSSIWWMSLGRLGHSLCLVAQLVSHKMAAILQTEFANAFSWMKTFKFQI